MAAGDFTIEAGSPDGRQMKLASKDYTGLDTGDATHLAIVKDTVTEELLLVVEIQKIGCAPGVTSTLQEGVVARHRALATV